MSEVNNETSAQFSKNSISNPILNLHISPLIELYFHFIINLDLRFNSKLDLLLF